MNRNTVFDRYHAQLFSGFWNENPETNTSIWLCLTADRIRKRYRAPFPLEISSLVKNFLLKITRGFHSMRLCAA